ncbi:hypothetical protein [Beijerinckia sp. L45]|uniref:hypothetical protein n=1 Tax=Beijerinckia sp. L45 TaxID=1641855 RepID=UPI00131D5374|nr:hypothetical protein [Beijerinckia sp. L45]
MRASLFGSLVAAAILSSIAVVSQGQPGFAQTAQPEATPPSAEKPSGRVGSLSPDEARRAARARARGAAAAAAKAAPAAPATDTASRQSAPPQKTDVAAHPDVVVRHTQAAATPLKEVAPARRTRQASSTSGPHVRNRAVPHYAARDVGATHEPRIGDRVPARVPLFPVASGYGSAPVYRESAMEPSPGVRLYAPYPMYRPGFPPYPYAGN